MLYIYNLLYCYTKIIIYFFFNVFHFHFKFQDPLIYYKYIIFVINFIKNVIKIECVTDIPACSQVYYKL